jgi:tripartite-type tricarboxylate transporter receptor subunit TctC
MRTAVARWGLAWALGACALALQGAYAQTYPAKVIRIVTAQVGSGNDIIARVMGQAIAPTLGQQVIVDNRGAIAIEITAKAPPDGYTLILYGTPLWLTSFMRDNVPWDVARDFAPVTWATNAPNVLVVHPSLPVRSVKELVAFAKARPGQLNYGSGRWSSRRC